MTAVTGASLEEVFSSLRKAGIHLWRQGDQLRYRAETGALTPEWRRQLLEQKAQILEFLRNAEGLEQEPSLRVTERGGNLPLSFAQQRLWFLDQFEPNRAAYNIPLALRLTGALDAAVLQRCLNEVLRRHESLRTCFKTMEGEAVQVIQPAASLEMPLVDLGGLPEPEREAEARRLCSEEAQRPFNLTQDVLLRVRLFQLGEADHILLLTMHHIASDGWSIRLLVGELGALYVAFIEDKPSPLAGLPVQYADYAAWQRAWLHGAALEGQLDYWRKQLEGAPAVLELPTDRPRPAVQTYRGALITGELPKPLSAALKELSRAEGATLFMTLLAAFQTLLHRYSGSDQIVVGSPIAGRQRPELECLIGFFVNTLVVRGDLSGDPSFRALLTRTREAALGAYAHQDLPFEKLVEELRPDRRASHAPIFQVLFVLQDAPLEAPALPRLEVAPIPIDIGISKFDLTLSVREHAGHIDAVAEYNTDLFEAETIRRMLRHYQALLEGIVADPAQRLSDLPLLTEAERQQLLVEWNRTAAAYPKDQCLHQLFEEQVERTPEAVAVAFDGEQLTYRALNQRANQLARHLQGLGVGPDALVAICVERSLEMVVGLLGILKAGGAYVPLDPSFPGERLAFMFRDSGARLLLTEQRLRDRVQTGSPDVRVVCVDGDWAAIARSPTENSESGAGAENLAYVIYTSGSTGQPKGVEVRHRNLANLLCAMAREPGFAPGDKLLAVTTISFDIAALELFLPLVVGGQVMVAPASELPDGFALRRRLELSGATVMQATPATWTMLIEAGWPGNSSLRVLCGGEAVAPALADALLTRAKEVWNVYGPTETTIWSSFERIRTGHPITIGRPIANTQFYVVDKAKHPAPVGVPGELLIGGDGLAQGYHNRPELTLEKFIANPFSRDPGARLYKTGDLVRRLPNGAIEFLGRLDLQVKIRGFRVELGETESALAGLPGVREAVVLAREDNPDDKRLVAYLIVKEGEQPKDSELRGLLRAKLPEYMIPSAFVILDRFPLTPNGKVDRKALPKPDLQSSNAAEFVLPSTQLEKALASIWRQALGVERVGLHDNFFELGGHSLLAIRVIAQMNKTLNGYVNVPRFFQNPTIDGLARSFAQEQHVRPKPRVLRLQRGHEGPPLYFIGAGPVEIRIAKLMGKDRAVFGTDVPMPTVWRRAMANGDRAAWPTMEQLGALHGEVIQAHVGRAPCVVAGYSFQGKVVVEAARALRQAGGNLVLVLLIDSTAWARPMHSIQQAMLRNLRLGWRGLAGGSADDSAQRKSVRTSLCDSWRLLRWLLAQAPPALLRRMRSSNADVEEANGFFDEEGVSVTVADMKLFFRILMISFDPRPVDAAAVLFRTTHRGDKMLPRDTLDNGWGGRFARGLEIVQAKGDHWTLVTDERNTALLAQQINAILDRYVTPKSSPMRRGLA